MMQEVLVLIESLTLRLEDSLEELKLYSTPSKEKEFIEMRNKLKKLEEIFNRD